jgi:uncharacterized protein YkwD
MFRRILLFTLAALTTTAFVSGQPSKQKDQVKLTAEEQLIFELTNQERAKAKLPALKLNPLLCKIAKGHSQNMGRHKKMEHVLDGKTPADRMDAAGYDFLECNENIAWVANTKSLKPMFEGWMKSKTHRDNIMGNFEELGISIVAGPGPDPGPNKGKDGLYITQVFGTQQKQP